MPRAPEHLNDKQLRVLRWVERGCPDGEYVDDNYGHRITAKALAGRGLVRIEGQGKTWRASLTAAGKARAAELKGAAASEPEDTSDIAALIARLDAAGGRLDVDERAEGVEYGALVRRANKSALRPHGRELHLSPVRWQTPWVMVLEYREWSWDLVEAPVVAPVSPGARLGPIAKRFLTEPDGQFVTKDSLGRASCILEAVVRHAAGRGMTTRDPRDVDKEKQRKGQHVSGWSGHVEVETAHTALRLQVREIPGSGAGRFEYYKDGWNLDRKEYDRIQRLPVWQRNRNYHFLPTGRLEIRLARPNFGFDGVKWGDTKTKTLEDRLGEVFRHIEVADREARAAQDRAEAAKTARAQAWEAAMASARVRFRAAQERALVVERARTWREHEDLQAFVGELRRRGDDDPQLQRWIEIGDTVLRRADPFADLREPDLPKPSLADLAPFLDGWSPYGPDARR